MSKMSIGPLEDDIRASRIAGELERSEEAGRKAGIKEGRKKGRMEGIEETERRFVSKLLKFMTPEEISRNLISPLITY